MDGGARQVTVHRVTKSWTRLKRLSTQHAQIVACQAPLSVEFLRQEYWRRLPFPPAGNLLDPGIKPASLGSPALAGGFFTTQPSGKLMFLFKDNLIHSNLHCWFISLELMISSTVIHA